MRTLKSEGAELPGMSAGMIALAAVLTSVAVIGLFILGICVAAMFLPIVLVLVGLVVLWKSRGQPPLLYIGVAVVLIGALLYLWWA